MIEYFLICQDKEGEFYRLPHNGRFFSGRQALSKSESLQGDVSVVHICYTGNGEGEFGLVYKCSEAMRRKMEKPSNFRVQTELF